jgi:hypothetical protein
MAWRPCVTLLTAVALGAGGCGPAKLNQEFTFDVGNAPAQAWQLPKQTVAQTVKVEVETDSQVDVYVLTGVDQDRAVNMEPQELHHSAVASKTGVSKDSLSVPIPAKTAAVVVVRVGAKKLTASGMVKLTN